MSASSDLTFVVICIPFIAYHYAAENWTIGDLTCKLYQFLVYVTTYVTVYTLVAVAAVRVCKVTRAVGSSSAGRPSSATTTRSCTAFRCRCYIRFFACGSCFPTDGWDSRSRRAVGVIVATLWAVALAANVPVFFLYRVKTTAEQQMQPDTAAGAVGYGDVPYVYCGISDQLNGGRQITFTFFAFAYVAPLASIATMYFRLLRQLRRKQRETSISSIDSGRQPRVVVVVGCEAGSSFRSTAMVGGNGSEATVVASAAAAVAARNGSRRNSRVTRVLVVVVAVFAVCWLPLHVHLLVAYSGAQPTRRWYEIYRVLAHCLAYSNSCMNPVIYSYVSTDFRRQFADVVLGAWARACRCSGFRNTAATTTVAGETAVEENGGGEVGADGTSSARRLVSRSSSRSRAAETTGHRAVPGNGNGRTANSLLSPPEGRAVCRTSSVSSSVCAGDGPSSMDVHTTAL